ncbi:hypothetical protein ACQ9ZF_08985 (plasmid) [Cetobacterium somerae]|uniref:hypothetical protein n=1 Tax=Cetobacterium somerae TaxID=188913 RepID=UPI003D768B73
MEIAIVVVGYNRPNSIKRLLNSLSNSIYPKNKNIKLIISIDKFKTENEKLENEKVLQIAQNFEWINGEKIIKYQKNNLGLKNHILSCGDLTKEYENIILLEDDLYVSPYFYDYSMKCLSYYNIDKKIAGISLYKHNYNESAGYPFYPLEDSGDVFFMQIASSWGQMWSKRMWNSFRKWFDNNPEISECSILPEDVKNWPSSSWKKHFIDYLVSNNLYFVYPRISLTTNFMDCGTHHSGNSKILQNSLLLKEKEYKFINFCDSLSRYDSYCEIESDILKLFDLDLSKYDFIVDLYGTKNISLIKNKEYILTSKKITSPIKNYALELKPHENNIIFKNKGEDIFFGKITDIVFKRNELKIYEYFYTNITKGIAKLFLEKIIMKLFKERG